MSVTLLTGVHVSDVPAIGSHFSMAVVANVSAIVEVELPSKTRSTEVVIPKDKAKLTAPTTSNTPLAVVVAVGLIEAATFRVKPAVAVIDAAIAIVAVLCSMLSFRP